MDVILKFYDKQLLTPYVYPVDWLETYWLRQFISLYFIVFLHSILIYLSIASFSYFFIFDKIIEKHPKYLKNQVKLEIWTTISSLPLIAFLTVSVFVFEIRGYSRLYSNINDSQYGIWAILFQAVTFILFTDALIYWIHRILHTKYLYKYVHKLHHKWIVPTPFASHAFHPIDGFLQSSPYHIYVFLFPMYKYSYLAFFFFVNIWTVSIHDSDYRVLTWLRPFINGSAHHTDHHIYFTCNYGQFFTLWDRLCGSFKQPSAFTQTDPKSQLKNEKQN